MLFRSLFGGPAEKKRLRAAAQDLYETVVGQARQPSFYAELGVADTVDGRFDCLVLHAYLLIRRLKGEGETGQALAQAVFDTMFTDLDRNLRELGVSDIRIGVRIKKLAKIFYGRADAYDKGLAAEDGDATLMDALDRNLYKEVTSTPGHLRAVAAYLRRESAALAAQPWDDLNAGRLRFGSAPGAADSEEA